MLFRGGNIWLGRWEEPVTPRERAVHAYVVEHARRAEGLLAQGFVAQFGKVIGRPIQPDAAWNDWTVAVLQGWRPRVVLFQHWEGFGTEAFPRFKKQIRYVPGIDLVEIEQGRLTDPSILHRSWDLIGSDGVPEDRRNRGTRSSWLSSYRSFGAALERTGLCDHPRAQTMHGLKQMLALRGMDLKVDRYGVPSLERQIR